MATKLKLPKTPGATADALYLKRAARLKLEKDVEALQADETTLKDHLFKLLPKLEATAISGKVATVSLERQLVPDIQDWDEVVKYIVRKKAYELLYRQVNVKAWRERNDAKDLVAGTRAFPKWKVHCSKLGGKKTGALK